MHPYSDLLLGRVDAVLLDHVLAERRQRTMAGFTTQPQTVAVGHYVGVLAARDAALRDTIDEILRDAMRDGSLERIFRKWNVWNEDQPKLYAKLLAGEPVSPAVDDDAADRDRHPVGMGGRAAVLSVAPARLVHHPRALVPGDGTGRGPRRAHRHGTRVRRPGRCASFSSATWS